MTFASRGGSDRNGSTADIEKFLLAEAPEGPSCKNPFDGRDRICDRLLGELSHIRGTITVLYSIQKRKVLFKQEW